MIYTCNDCKFIFSRVGAVDACPCCDSTSIREATEAEQNCFQNSGISEEQTPPNEL